MPSTATPLATLGLVTVACLHWNAACCAESVAQTRPTAEPAKQRPNVLFISIDDLNDWIGCLGRHPDAFTPNLDRLARRGTLFSDAHCAAPLCNPSRAAVFSGCAPVQTRIFSNDGDIRRLHADLRLLPQTLADAGYVTFGAGKLLHQASGSLVHKGFFPHLRWSPFAPDDVLYTPTELLTKGTPGQQHRTLLNGKELSMPLNGMPSDRHVDAPNGESFDWGALPVSDAEMGDAKIAGWGAEVLSRRHEKPFFLAMGFYRPHIPLFAPEAYFDRFQKTSVALPASAEDDLADLPPIAKSIALEADTAGKHATVLKYGQWSEAIRAYLACVSFVDAQVGKLVDALDAGPNASNTVIVLWSDHGWHLGEKQHWGKWTLWERSTRVPLIIVPLVPPERQEVSDPVSLLDLYPTVLELTDVADAAGRAGRSLVPYLHGVPADASARMVLTTRSAGNHSLTGRTWRYIRYEDGSEELYDRQADPGEVVNLAANGQFSDALQSCRSKLRDEISRLLAARMP